PANRIIGHHFVFASSSVISCLHVRDHRGPHAHARRDARQRGQRAQQGRKALPGRGQGEKPPRQAQRQRGHHPPSVRKSGSRRTPTASVCRTRGGAARGGEGGSFHTCLLVQSVQPGHCHQMIDDQKAFLA